MEPRPLRAAVVGCGAIASDNDLGRSGAGFGPLTHAGAWRAHGAVDLVAAADVDPERLGQFGEAWGVRALYRDYRELLQCERVDLLSVCVPDPLHADVVLAAVEAGVCGVLCEKPLATTPGDARRVLQACEGAGTVLAVNYFRRWNATLDRLREGLRAGDRGRVLRVNAWYPGGVLHNGTHAIDLVQWFVGEISQVRALGCRWTDPKDPTVDAFCLTKDDVPVVLHGVDSEVANILEVEILTSTGRVRVAQNGRRLEYQPLEPDPVYPRYRLLRAEPEVIPTAWDGCLAAAAADLVRCVLKGGTPRCSGPDAYRAMEVALAAQRSGIRGGEPVEVPPGLAAALRRGEGWP